MVEEEEREDVEGNLLEVEVDEIEEEVDGEMSVLCLNNLITDPRDKT